MRKNTKLTELDLDIIFADIKERPSVLPITAIAEDLRYHRNQLQALQISLVRKNYHVQTTELLRKINDHKAAIARLEQEKSKSLYSRLGIA